MINLSRDIVWDMMRHAMDEDTMECCGLILGKNRTGKELVRMTNLASIKGKRAGGAYEMDPIELFSIHEKIRRETLSIVAVYHSHPWGPMWPSYTDTSWAHDENGQVFPEASYIIVTLVDGQPKVAAFRLDGNKVFPEIIKMRHKWQTVNITGSLNRPMEHRLLRDDAESAELSVSFEPLLTGRHRDPAGWNQR